MTIQIIGYLNRVKEFPAPLITLCEVDSNKFMALYPSGAKEDLPDVKSIDDIFKIANKSIFIKEEATVTRTNYKTFQFISFAFDKNKPIDRVNSDKNSLLRELKARSQGMSGEAAKILDDYIYNLSSSGNGLSVKAMETWVSATDGLQIQIIRRRKKSKTNKNSSELRYFLRVQKSNKKSTKTIYSKGLNNYQYQPDKFRFPPSVSIDLIDTCYKLAQHI